MNVSYSFLKMTVAVHIRCEPKLHLICACEGCSLERTRSSPMVNYKQNRQWSRPLLPWATKPRTSHHELATYLHHLSRLYPLRIALGAISTTMMCVPHVLKKGEGGRRKTYSPLEPCMCPCVAAHIIIVCAERISRCARSVLCISLRITISQTSWWRMPAGQFSVHERSKCELLWK